MKKYIYDPPKDRYAIGFKVGETYEGDYENNPCFKLQEAKKPKTKEVKKEETEVIE